MFEDVEVLAARLLAADPDQADPDSPALDTDGGLVDELVTLQRLIAAGQARTMTILAGLCRRAQSWQDAHDPRQEAQVGPADLVAAEIGPALRLTPATAATHVHRAVTISTRLPGTLAAFAAGRLDLGRVLAINEATHDLSDADTAKVETKVLPRATEQAAGELRAALKRAVIAVDPGAAERRRKRAVKDRTVERFTDKDGTSVLRAVLSAVDTGEIYDLLEETARRTKTTGDTRSMGARRVDALTWLLLGRDPHLGPEDDPPPGPQPPERDRWPVDPHDGATHAEPDWHQPTAADDPTDRGDEHGARPTEPDDLDDRLPPDPTESEPLGPTRSERISELAALALSAMTTRRPPRLPWVTINQATGADGEPVLVGELQGYGPITNEYAQHLLATGAARTPDLPTGREPTPAQANRHDPPDWLAHEIRTRDGTCRYPGCRQPAHRTDLDHVIPHPRGLTVRANLGGLCRRHHRIKGTGWWRVTQHDDATYTWHSTITGATYTTHPRGTTGEWRGTTTHRRAPSE